jgi:DNA-binding response OmpR family regulator
MFVNLKKVLIVDDTEDLRGLLKNWISFRGLEGITAVNGREATDILQQEPIDLIITDFQMPEMDGLELLEWCRSRGRFMPVVFMSATEQVFGREELALGDCCATRLAKPINFQILAAALEAAERHEHHRDCVHHPFKLAVEEQHQLAQEDELER